MGATHNHEKKKYIDDIEITEYSKRHKKIKPNKKIKRIFCSYQINNIYQTDLQNETNKNNNVKHEESLTTPKNPKEEGIEELKQLKCFSLQNLVKLQPSLNSCSLEDI